ncbi:MAG: EthD domain-containing protein [Sphingomonadaceae bacterium]|nr:EthD domain-containing protein [Sphingomonadaceae bacterium]
MIKVMLFVKRKPGLTHEEFRARYESGHVPLAISELPHLVQYRRNFVKPTPGMAEVDFDVVTEFWFDNKEGWKATAAYALDPVKGRTLADDEAVFMDRSTMRFVMVEEEIADVDAVRASQRA